MSEVKSRLIKFINLSREGINNFVQTKQKDTAKNRFATLIRIEV